MYVYWLWQFIIESVIFWVHLCWPVNEMINIESSVDFSIFLLYGPISISYLIIHIPTLSFSLSSPLDESANETRVRISDRCFLAVPKSQNPDPSLAAGASESPFHHWNLPEQHKMIAIPYLTALTTYFSYGLLFAFGQFRDFFRKIFDWCSSNNLQARAFSQFLNFSIFLYIYCFSICALFVSHYQGYAPICLGLEDFYIRRLYLRIQVRSINFQPRFTFCVRIFQPFSGYFLYSFL